ncbi:sortase-dependent protein [Streptomyces sp. NPDC059169]|uniref:sortase-dependent protein n=1 Tax=Streptomyces sp. NPDC059169 TaxID=3346754 RepID=UPI0036C09BAC
MRRTVLSAMALACTAVLAGTVPAFANGASPTPTTAPSRAATPADPSEAPSAVPTRGEGAASPVPVERTGQGQVTVVPKGAPDTGVAVSSVSGGQKGLIGAGAAAVSVTGAAGVYFVRRRRVTGV